MVRLVAINKECTECIVIMVKPVAMNNESTECIVL